MKIKRKTLKKGFGYLVIALVLIFMIFSCIGVKGEDQGADFTKKEDLNIFDVTQEKVVISEEDEFILSEYIDQKIDSRIISIADDVVNKVGTYNIKLLGISPLGHSEVETLTVEVMDKESYERYTRKQRASTYKFSCPISDDPYTVAQCFVGMTGWCTTIAQKFVNHYLGSGYNIFDTYDISYSEAIPGDIIYYTNGGLGMQHYAVYLGGELALQGNMDGGIAKIGSIYLTHGSEPQFRRLSGR